MGTGIQGDVGEVVGVIGLVFQPPARHRLVSGAPVLDTHIFVPGIVVDIGDHHIRLWRYG